MSALIFNPYFILINLFAFFLLLLLFLLAVSLRLFLSCPLTLLLLIFRFCIPLEKPEGFWFSGVSRGRGMGVLGTFGSINDDLIWLMKFPVYALWGRQRACDSRVFSGIWNWNVGQRWGEHRKQIYISNKNH